MPYIFKFKPTDKIINLVRTYPAFSFVLYDGKAYYNNQKALSGSFSSNVLGVPPGHVSLYEMAVDKHGYIDFNNINVLLNSAGYQKDPFGYAVDSGTSPTQFYLTGATLANNPHPSAFKTKDGSRINFKTLSTAQFNAMPDGRPSYRNYPLSASIYKDYYSAATPKTTTSSYLPTLVGNPAITGSVTFLQALRVTMNSYAVMNPNYYVSSSARNLLASGSEPGALDVGLLSVPHILYGDGLKKGSIDLKFYVTGTLVGHLRDTRRNGDLLQIGPSGSGGSGSVAGVALYNEGFLVLTSSIDLTNGEYVESSGYGTSHNYPSWVNFAQCISSSAPAASSSLCTFDYSGSNRIPTLMLFANAPANRLNHSNNPTYRDQSTPLVMSTGSTGYIQNKEALIKNVVSSSYNDPTGSFAKTTYISRIGIYDANKNLIAIAKLANPVKKTEERNITFKLKLDI